MEKINAKMGSIYSGAFYKRTQVRCCGKLTVVSYLKILPDGSIQCIDTTRMETSHMKTFGGIPMTLERCAESDWIEASRILKDFYNI